MNFIKDNAFYLLMVSLALFVVCLPAEAKPDAGIEAGEVTVRPLRNLDGGIIEPETPDIPGIRPDREPPGLMERRSSLMEVAYGMKNAVRQPDSGFLKDGGSPDDVEMEVLWTDKPGAQRDVAIMLMKVPGQPRVALIFIYTPTRGWDLAPEAFQ